jgi:hypothetical protein
MTLLDYYRGNLNINIANKEMILKLMKIGNLKHQMSLLFFTLMLSLSALRAMTAALPRLIIVALTFTLLPCSYAYATTISVTSERNPVTLNESFQLTFSATETPDGDPDFSILESYVEILNQHKNSNTSIINGQFQHQESWHLNVLAKQSGVITLPSVPFGKDLSNTLIITVVTPDQHTKLSSPQPDKDLFLLVEVSPQEGIVQSQFIYTLRLFRRVKISQASLTEPTSDTAIIERLGEDITYQDQHNNLTYEVTERKYAIFPQQSGLLTIAPVALNAEVYSSQRGQFNGLFNRSRTRIKRVFSDAIQLNVQPIPAPFTAPHWLPAQALHIEQSWSGDITDMKVGEPLTRTLKIIAQGTTVGQLPELHSLQSNAERGLKTYPDKPALNEKKTDTLIAYREEKIAFIASKEGLYQLPAIKVPWWNTQTQSVELALIPETTLIATLAPQSTEVIPDSTLTSTPQLEQPLNSAPTAPPQVTRYFWPGLSLFLALGWLLTLLLAHRKSKSLSTPEQQKTPPYNQKVLKQACAAHSAEAAKNALLLWGQQYFQEKSLRRIASYCDAPLKKEILLLNTILYSPDCDDWNGENLYTAFKAFEPKALSTDVPPNKLKPLYKL